MSNILKVFCGCLVGCAITAATSSCEDFFEQESEHIIDSGQEHLNNRVDTLFSLTGILSKLQALGDRTILLGEVRADLVDLTADASADLRELATLKVGDDNEYNHPSDYYAVINNCNYYIAHVDTALKNNRNEYIFMREYAVIKAIRAWTYLQLVLNYGSVPFVTEPILSKEEAERQHDQYDLLQVCDYFINDLEPLSPQYGNQLPLIGAMQSLESRHFYYPLDVILGDLYLWAAGQNHQQQYYRQAALHYYKYLSERNGDNSQYSTGTARAYWPQNNTDFNSRQMHDSWSNAFYGDERNYSSNNELITIITGDSLPSEPNYSQLNQLFNSVQANDYKASITPSAGLAEISEAQQYCMVANNATTVTYAPHGLADNLSGDLRLAAAWSHSENVYVLYSNGQRERIDDYQYIRKWGNSRNVPILRRQMVYWRMAEALNQAGYPRMAFLILSTGINNQVIRNEVEPYYAESDTLFLRRFDFPAGNDRYSIYDVEKMLGLNTQPGNTMGMHSRGSGWTPLNEYYQLPNDTIEFDDVLRQQLIAEQQQYVDSLLIVENALEFAFEGTRFYDLMRFALRSSNPGQYMADHIYARRGKANAAEVSAEVAAVSDPRNWYLSWKGQIGMK